ncbi:MAG: hypothetical protein H6741_27700 [Alphaproteobacteria bacterium]|nr:hypothetical protein [Alphaproteobacteria bacterium]
MNWRSAGPGGDTFRAQVDAQPGWYWVHRPRNIGERAFDPKLGVLLPVWVGEDGALSSPLAELQSVEDLVCHDVASDARYASVFAGPVHPGERSGFIEVVDGVVAGAAPEAEGWHWCRTEAPLNHVDRQGIGPVFLKRKADGATWVYPASTVEGEAVDIWELGFSEPLVTARGVIDADGEVGRSRAEFFGRIRIPEGLPEGFPAL